MTELTCIVCPKGCRLKVDEENGFAVTGASCQRGIAYGKRSLQLRQGPSPLQSPLKARSTAAFRSRPHRKLTARW